MVVFGEDGRRIPATVPLPPDVVWVAHPEENDLVSDGAFTVVVEAQLPLGWSGWLLRQVNLETARSLGLDGLPETRRPVRGHTRQGPRGPVRTARNWVATFRCLKPFPSESRFR